ncbi:MAG: hypothetical protein IIA45_02185 [Bacteroidetes bacterium]|nr:hypothetical protein [Bacteroidota bacterium]
MDGTVIITPEGLSGLGDMDVQEASMASNDYQFSSNTFDADTMAWVLRTQDPNIIAFSAPNVKAHIDFDKQIGEFHSNGAAFSEFPINQYKTSMDFITWEIDKKLVNFESTKNVNPYFVSTHPEQDSLKFQGKIATFNTITYDLTISGVDHIRVADVKIFPDSQLVVIKPNAIMERLIGAVINADTTDDLHVFYDASVKILSRNDYNASGFIDYVNITEQPQSIFLDDIHPVREYKFKRDKKGALHTYGFGTVPKEQELVLNPGIQYYGKVEVYAPRKSYAFDGFALLSLKNPDVVTQGFSFSDVIDPESLIIHVEDPISETNAKLYAGIHLTQYPTVMYTSVLNTKQAIRDTNVFVAEGLLQYDIARDELTIGNEAKLNDGALRGNLWTYNDSSGNIYAEGKFNLGMDMGLLEMLTSGSMNYYPDSNHYEFDLVTSLDFTLPPQAVSLMIYDFEDFTYGQDDIDYETESFPKALAEFPISEKKLLTMTMNIDVLGKFKMPPEMNKKLFLTDVHLVWDSASMSYRSFDPIGVGFIENKAIGKMVDAFYEVGRNKKGGFFNLFFQLTEEEYYFFTYQGGILACYSSNKDFNRAITAIPVRKRKIKSPDGRIFIFTVATDRKAKNFRYKMTSLLNLNNNP